MARRIHAHRPSEARANRLLRGSFAAELISEFFCFYRLLAYICEDDISFHEGGLEVKEIRSHATQVRLRISGRTLEKGVDTFSLWDVDDPGHREVSLDDCVTEYVDSEVVRHRAILAHLNQQSCAEVATLSGSIVAQEGVVGEDLPGGRELHVR